jgi:hypothetical protein
MKFPELVFLVVLLAACQRDKPPAASAEPFRPVADVQQVMLSILEPAAETYWDAVGWIIDFEGTHEIRPGSAEEWDAVRNAAYVVAESGNLLMMEGRAIDDGAWVAMSQAMVDIGERAAQAAEARDEAAVFTIGGDLYEGCTACHSSYAVGTLRPSAAKE